MQNSTLPPPTGNTDKSKRAPKSINSQPRADVDSDKGSSSPSYSTRESLEEKIKPQPSTVDRPDTNDDDPIMMIVK